MSAAWIAALDAIPDLKWSADADDLQRYGVDWTRIWQPDPLAVIWPRSIEQVQAVVRMCAQHNIAIVPSGGRTGLSGGAVATQGEIVVSLERMNAIGTLDPVDRVIQVQAGATLQSVQEFAAEHGLQYPVDLAARGSCTIGGNIATNAGGIRVLKYGNTREWIAGVTAVLANGEVVELNNALVKNSSGFDLRHLLIGSEGTLAIVVAAQLRLTSPLPESQVMLLGLSDIQGVMSAYTTARAQLTLQAFEFLDARAMHHVLAAGAQAPLESQCPYYAIVEFDADQDAAMRVVEQGMEQGWCLDGAFAQDTIRARQLWHYRESITENIAKYTPYKNDISVRVSRIPQFMAAAQAMLSGQYADLDVIWFGHIGDGNLHISILKPGDTDMNTFVARCGQATGLLAQLLGDHQGSVSAEHGIGLLKRDYLSMTRGGAEIAAMRAIKQALDPQGLFNPGKMLRND